MSKKKPRFDDEFADYLGLTMSHRTLFFTDGVAPNFLGLHIKTEAQAYAEVNIHNYDGPPRSVLSAEATASDMAALRRAYVKFLAYHIEYIRPDSPQASASVKVRTYGAIIYYPDGARVLFLLDGSRETLVPYGGLDEEKTRA